MSSKTLEIINPNYYSFKDDKINDLKFDVLGGVDMSVVERMYCTLRISFQHYPPIRHTLDLYADNHSEQLVRKLCTSFDLNLIDVTKTIAELTRELEEYRLKKMRIYNHDEYIEPNDLTFTKQEIAQAKESLQKETLLEDLQSDFRSIGVFNDINTVLTLFVAMNSFAYHNPLSVICIAKKGAGKSRLLQQLAECLPPQAYSVHSEISDNALYYFENEQINKKLLIVEDLDWTESMLRPLTTLQSQGRLIKTRATKDKNGNLNSTSFQVKGKLCLVACTYTDKQYEKLGLPFLILHLDQKVSSDLEMMEYQKQIKSGKIDIVEQFNTKRRIQAMSSELKNINIINPYATLIELPFDLNNPSHALEMFLDFVEILTYFHQFQRQRKTNQKTGEEYVLTHPKDIETAFILLKGNVLKVQDELPMATRDFFNWLKDFLTQNKITEFTNYDIRANRKFNPRSLNRYLQELCAYYYIQRVSGSKFEGYKYKLTEIENINHSDKTDTKTNEVMKRIWQTYNEKDDDKEIKSNA